MAARGAIKKLSKDLGPWYAGNRTPYIPPRDFGRAVSDNFQAVNNIFMFDEWCEQNEEELGERKRLLRLAERAKGREAVWPHLCRAVRSHYDELKRIERDIEDLGYSKAAEVLRERLPRTDRARSGEIGEILGTELVEEGLGFKIPVRRLRYKDGREMALRGDDFVGIRVDDEDRLHLMKGEAKSRKRLGKTTITEARAALSRDNGRPTPSSLLFVADRLLDSEGEDSEIGRKLRNEVALRAVPARNIDHVLFTLSGNTPPAALTEDLQQSDGEHPQTVINMRVDDHPDFIRAVYEEAGTLGDG